MAEECDVGPHAADDGCSDTCTVDSLWECTGEFGEMSTCNNLCGNGVSNPGEECDTGVIDTVDGCSNLCTEEDQDVWYCTGFGAGSC